MTLADKIIKLRKQHGWSQEDLADKMDVSRQAVSKWECAQTIPDIEKILQLSQLFNVSTDYLLKDTMPYDEQIQATQITSQQTSNDDEGIQKLKSEYQKVVSPNPKRKKLYWLILILLYLAISFLSHAWSITWLLFPIAYILFSIFYPNE
ncbi:MAG: helix-turn-helix domain-containing protein [Erysipelotrichaceae bacterium]|nr:helix-turn-helix domain-containing protein [Erysipelotrichaceae bacterium]